ncbi:hypothetical protein C8F01DRAFT_1130927, partial [Mycena amicta]
MRGISSSSAGLAALLILLWIRCCCGLSASSHVGARALVPFKKRSSTSASIQSRAAWKREIAPKDLVVLEYGLEAAEFPSTSLKFIAHESTPIVLLEDIDYLVDSIACHPAGSGAVVELSFRSEEPFAEALATWSTYSGFILVTSHLSCNAHDSRGAWFVNGVNAHHTYPQISLLAQFVPLREMGKSYKISHTSGSVSSAWRHPEPAFLDKRFDKLIELGHTLDLAPRQQLFPPDLSLLTARDDSGNSSGSGITTSTSGDITVFCVDCVSRTNFSVGIELEVADLGTSITAAHVNVTVQEFQHDIQLEIAMDGTFTISKNEDVIRTPLPDLGITIPDVATVGFFYGGSVSASLQVTGGLNFTIGAKTSVPSGATASYVLAGNGTSGATGWQESSFELVPFRLNSGSLNATAQLSLSPFLDIEFDLLTKFKNQARLSVNTPQLVASA